MSWKMNCFLRVLLVELVLACLLCVVPLCPRRSLRLRQQLVIYRLVAALQPRGVSVDGGGRVYVADLLNGRVLVFSADGSARSIWPIAGSVIAQPVGIAVDQTSGNPYSGNVFVSDRNNGAGRIVVFNSSGAQINSIRGGQLRSIGQVALDGHGRVWTCDSSYGTAHGFDMQSGSVVGNIAGFTSLGPVAIAFSAGSMYVLGQFNGQAVYQVTGGSITATWQLPASTSPTSLAFSASGAVLYVVDASSGVLIVNSSTGQLTGFVNASTTNGAIPFSATRHMRHRQRGVCD